ncbi:MAG: hypothetical protein R2711_17055 [Acidimicrobiales bacterium]
MGLAEKPPPRPPAERGRPRRRVGDLPRAWWPPASTTASGTGHVARRRHRRPTSNLATGAIADTLRSGAALDPLVGARHALAQAKAGRFYTTTHEGDL